MTQWYGVGASHQGLVRPTNQDAFLIENELQLWAVADGMGGHPGGDVASRLVIDSIAAQARQKAIHLQGRTEQAEPVLREMIESAHHAILDHSRRHLKLAGMGTTLTLLHISSQPFPVATIINEGDSRAYLLRNSALTQLTRDHSIVEEYVEQGLLSVEQALHHPQRHMLSRAVGLGPRSDADIRTHHLEPNDLLMLCTDGLTKMVEDAHIESTMNASPHDPAAACRALLMATLDAGGIDNITVVVLSLRA